jgi:hypothetical protein
MNKLFFTLVVSVCLVLLLTTGCTTDKSSTPSPADVPEVSPTPGIAEEVESISEFSVVTATENISLQDWDNEVDIGFLGTPDSEEVRVLDQTSDTFSGSHVKKLKYDGLELELFSPKDNGKSFWVKEILITGSEFSSPRGINISAGLEELTKKYPEIKQVPDGRTDLENSAYIYTDDGFSNMLFEVKDGKVDTIRIYQELP